MKPLAALGLAAVLGAAVLGASASTARAQEPAPAERRVIVLEETTITPARPAAMTFIARARPASRVEDLRSSFTTEIVAATGGAPF